MENVRSRLQVHECAFGDQEAIADEEVRSQIDRIVQSILFQRSERLQRFLRFVCDYTLRGESQQLHEYLIGSKVFDRGPNYLPNEDGIVRRQAHALRRKLQEYYEKDGVNDPIRIDLPVGRYVPVFRRTVPPEEPPVREEPMREEMLPHQAIAPAVIEPAPTAPPAVLSRAGWLMLVAAGLLLFGSGWAAAYFTRDGGTGKESESIGRPNPSVADLWKPWLSPQGSVLICFSNPLTAVLKHMNEPLSPQAMPQRILLTPEQEKLYRSVVALPAGGYLYLAPAISQAKMGEAFAAVSLTSLFAESGVRVRTTQSRFVSWEDLTRENMILLGNNEANPWLDRVLQGYPLQLMATSSDKQRAIVYRQPNGEPKYQIKYGAEPLSPTEEYVLISMLPGVDGRHRLLLINGLNTQATQVGAEFLTAEESARELLRRLRSLEPNHRGPWYFQAVLRTEVHDKVPTRTALVDLKIVGH
jgi:hypothetical protein